ncbi:SprT family zinc-dependent metalloprotease [Micromonospora sp. WMMC241]|uniref:M48 family metallopeptidase n=1 Tax=Micromonospora sp. WMMC241 TaxID=3015159 RepID=UPI0022B70599|nr:SprT family zinc-dependent metalloprotease [Micromonospora sp. WMMC241]MCZ7440367.1 SprT family zinc-dependent metalloprotease [Micromonospora sp. WMMC241]
MSTANAYMTVRGIEIDIVYKDIKNLHIGVYPPLGRVRVAAPLKLDDDHVRMAVIQRLPWIKKQREQLRSAERQSAREMVTGESHYVWGIRHRLKVVERPGRAHVEVNNERLLLYVPPATDSTARLAVLQGWQREQLRARIPELIGQWETVIGRKVVRWSIRRMKTKWGSCNRETRHIWFNLELAKKHPHCLEYIIVHEMTHLLERNHGERFSKLMDKFLPDWRARRNELNDAPLADEEWDTYEGTRLG